ncbi:hypothetical protein Tco_0635700 [Tanacetum coccineum]
MKEKIKYKRKVVVGTFINVPILVGNFSIVTGFTVMANMGAYRDKDMGDVIFRKPFFRDECVEARRFDGFITIHIGNDNITYQMARSQPRFKHLFNEQCTKIQPLLKVSARDKLEGNSHSFQYGIFNSMDTTYLLEVLNVIGEGGGYSQTSEAYIVLNKETMRIEESLNVTFDESLPEPKPSPSVKDDRIDEPIVQDLNGSPSLQVNVSDEGYPKSLKEARGHLIKQVIGELDERNLVLRLNKLRIFA